MHWFAQQKSCNENVLPANYSGHRYGTSFDLVSLNGFEITERRRVDVQQKQFTVTTTSMAVMDAQCRRSSLAELVPSCRIRCVLAQSTKKDRQLVQHGRRRGTARRWPALFAVFSSIFARASS